MAVIFIAFPLTTNLLIMLISISLYVFNVVCAATLAICRTRQLAMQSCVLCSFVRCGTSKQIGKNQTKKPKKLVELKSKDTWEKLKDA